MDIESACQKEVAELHVFFQQWFAGDLPDTDEAFERFESVMADDFQIVTPNGTIMQRETILQAVHSAHGTGPMKIWIKNHAHRFTLSDAALVTYEEWQTRGDETRGHLSTALFQVKVSTPNNVHWLHLHETWLEQQ